MQPTIEALPRIFDVFLSHNSAEKPAVEVLAEKLRDEYGLKPWFDKWHLASGSVWQDKLDEGLRSSRCCAIFLGPSGITPWQLQEMRVAQVLHAEQQPFQVIPVILPGGDGKNFPLFIRSNFNWIDFRSGLDNPEALKQLARSITGDEEPPPHAEFGSEICPFKGLDAFKEEDAEFFFGREIFVEQRLVEHLRSSRFLAVVGMSGSGKSSVVRAGLIPALRRGALLGKPTAPVLTTKPGARPLEELGVQLLPLLPGISLRQIIEDLKASERSLHLAFRSASAERHLLVIDQFEEVFTQTIDDEERQAFFKNIVYAATLSDSPLLIVITMRSDFLSKCAQYRDLNSLVCENLEQVPYMTSDELRRAITEPAKRAELKFQLGLVDLIMKEIDASQNNLPLLQHTLLELWQRRRENQLATAVYHELGGVQGSLAQHAERVYQQLGVAMGSSVRKMFMRLVTLGEGTEDTRRRAPKAELQSFGAGANEALELLIKHRLLTAAWDAATGEETIEVVHEALIRGWPRLSGWINEDRDFNRFRQKLTLDATEWDAHGRHDTEVYRGGPLEEAAGYLHARKGDLTELEQEFVRAAEAHHEAEIAKEKKRFTFLRRLFIVAAIGFVGAGIAAYVANNLRKVSYSKEVALRTLGMPDEDPRLLLQMAIDAFEMHPTMEAQEALRLAVQQANAKQIIRGFAADVRSASFSPSNNVLVTTSLDSTIKLWSPGNGRLIATIRTPFSNNTWFSPLGTYLWSYSDSTILLWNAADGRPAGSLNAGTLIAMANWSADESKLIVAGLDSTARILDVRTRHEIARIHDDSGRVQNAYFNKDGTRIVMQSMGKSLFRYAPYDVQLLDAHTFKPLAHLRSNSRRLTNAVRFSNDGKHILTYFVGSGLQGIEHPEEIPLMEIWDATTGALEYKINDASDWEVYCSGQFSPDGKYLLVTRNLNAVLYDGKTGKELRWFRGHTSQIMTATFFDSAKYIMTFGDDKTTRIWETETGKMITTLHGHRSTAVGAAVAQDGSALVTYGGDSTLWLYRKNPLEDFNYNSELFAARFTTSRYEEGESVISNSGIVTLFPYAGTVVRSYDVHTGQMRDEIPLASPLGQIDYNPLVGRAAYLLDDGSINTLDIEKHQWSSFGKTEREYNQFSSLTKDGQYVLIGTLSYNWALFDRSKKIVQLSNADKPSRFAALRPDGKEALVYYNDSGAMTRVELPSARVLNRWTKDHQRAPWYDPTGRRFITSTQELVTICDAINGDILGTVSGKYTSSFDISADGKLAVFACRDKTVQIIDLERGKLIKTVSGAENEVNVVAISSDGSKVVACEKNGTCEVWDTRSLERIAVLRGYKGTVQNAIFSRDGKLISTRGTKQDASCRVYYTDAEDVLKLAKGKLAAMQ